MTNKKPEKDSLAGFEQALAELEALVEALESGDTGLDESLAKFERGVALARRCQETLKTAELRVEQLLEDGSVAPFEGAPGADDPTAQD